MIKTILVFNNHGKPRLSKFFEPLVSADVMHMPGGVYVDRMVS